MSFALFPTYTEPVPPDPQMPDWDVPIQPNLDAASIHDVWIDDAAKADRLLSLLRRVAIGAIAIDTEFTYSVPSVDLGNGRDWNDPRSIVPLILSAAAWVPGRRRVVRFAIDLRVDELRPQVEELLRLNAVFVAHFIQAELHTLWALDVNPVLHQMWDTHVAAKALDLGSPPKEGQHALLGLCRRYGIDHPYAAAKQHLQSGFLGHLEDAPFSDLQIQYAMADAEATLRVYLAQQPDIFSAGLHAHLHQVEFPFAEANARIAWDGVPVDRGKLAALQAGLDRAVGHYCSSLRNEGLRNPSSPTQVRAFLESRGHGGRLWKKGKPSTDDSVLERIEARDPVIADIRRYRRLSRLRADALFDGTLFGADGRLHPNHRHLGAATGRSTCSAPNIVGISKTFRPVVTAPAGRALIELDFAQIEVCIAAAVHGDPDLLASANSTDVYAAMAQQFYASELTDEELALDTTTFKSAKPELRNRMKTFVLAVIYNMTDRGIADRFGVSLVAARAQRTAFFDRFPGLHRAKRRAEEDGAVRGFSPIAGGLRRSISAGPGAANQHVNTPVQGAAAVVFRQAVVDLYRHFRGSPTMLVLPVHDAVVLECDVDAVEAVSAESALIMRMAVRAYFPELTPRVDINTEDTSCWNKDGMSGSLDRFLEDPGYRL